MEIPNWPWNAEQISNIVEGELYSNVRTHDKYTSFVYDTRKLLFATNAIFIALVGVERDGHHYTERAYSKGIRCFLVSEKICMPEDAIQIYVRNTLEALQQLAEYRRKCINFPIIGITGSYGKTTVKEWLTSLLEKDFKVGKSPGSYNSQLGVAISILHLSSDCDLAIIEAGISKSGEMKLLEKMIKPDLGILTHMGEAHNKGFVNYEDKLQEKSLLFANSKIVWCLQKDKVIQKFLPDEIELRTIGNLIGSTIQVIESVETKGNDSLSITLNEQETHLNLNLSGRSAIENSELAICVAHYIGVTIDNLQNTLLQLHPISMQKTIIRNSNDTIITYDSYNADIDSVLHEIAKLKSQQTYSSVFLILTDLEHQGNELYSVQMSIINHAVNILGIQNFISIGVISKSISYRIEGLVSYESTDEFIKYVNFEIFSGCRVMLKGSKKYELTQLIPYISLRPHSAQLQISLDALSKNITTIKGLIDKKTGVIAMLKAEAYGIGSIQIAEVLQDQTVKYIMVASTSEAIELRKSGILLPLIVQNPTPDALQLLSKYNIEIVISDFWILERISKLDLLPPLHIEIDSGLGRLGFMPEEIDTLIENLIELKNKKYQQMIEISSVFTHLAASDEPAGDQYTAKQVAIYSQCVNKLKEVFPNIKMHVGNSNAAIRFPNYAFDFVRIGMGMFGLVKSNSVQFENVLTLLAPVIRIKLISKGFQVGYGTKNIIKEDRLIATLAIGYADGIPRSAGNGKWNVMINNNYYATIGNISMDLLMVDISGSNSIHVGDWATVIGGSLNELQSWHNISSVANTIPYEILSHLSKRLNKHYIKEEG